MSAAPTPALSPLGQRLKDLREMRAYWASHVDRQTEGYGPADAADMLKISDRSCRQVAGAIIAEGLQP